MRRRTGARASYSSSSSIPGASMPTLMKKDWKGMHLLRFHEISWSLIPNSPTNGGRHYRGGQNGAGGDRRWHGRPSSASWMILSGNRRDQRRETLEAAQTTLDHQPQTLPVSRCVASTRTLKQTFATETFETQGRLYKPPTKRRKGGNQRAGSTAEFTTR